MEQMQIGAVIVGLLALYPAWLMLRKAFLMTRKKVGVTILSLSLPAIVTLVCLLVPFLLHAESEVEEQNFFIDFVLFGVCLAAVVGLIGFVLDQLSEKPIHNVLSFAGCFAVAALPVILYFYSPQLEERFNVTLIASDSAEAEAPNAPVNDTPDAASEADASESDQNDQAAREELAP